MGLFSRMRNRDDAGALTVSQHADFCPDPPVNALAMTPAQRTFDWGALD